MNSESLTARGNNIFSIVIGIVALVFFITVLVTGVSLPTFIALVVIGSAT